MAVSWKVKTKVKIETELEFEREIEADSMLEAESAETDADPCEECNDLFEPNELNDKGLCDGCAKDDVEEDETDEEEETEVAE